MAFSVVCQIKGCGQLMKPYIDPNTNKIYCEVCDGEVSNVTNFIKHQLKMEKRFRPKKNEPYSVKCIGCSWVGKPILVNDDLICSNCKSPYSNMSTAFKLMLKEKLKEKE